MKPNPVPPSGFDVQADESRSGSAQSASRGHLFQAYRTALIIRLSRRQSHDHGNPSIDTGHRCRPVFAHGCDEGAQFAGEALRIAVHEEVERQVPLHRLARR